MDKAWEGGGEGKARETRGDKAETDVQTLRGKSWLEGLAVGVGVVHWSDQGITTDRCASFHREKY